MTQIQRPHIAGLTAVKMATPKATCPQGPESDDSPPPSSPPPPPSPPKLRTQDQLRDDLNRRLAKREVLLEDDPEGKPRIVDSLANRLEGLAVDPPPIWIDHTKQDLIKDDHTGNCDEGRHFEKIKPLKEATDDNKNEVYLVQGIGAAQRTAHVVKEIPRAEFNKNEVLAQKDLQFDRDFFATLFLVRRDKDKMCLHFTLVPDGTPVADVCARLKRWLDQVMDTDSNDTLLVRQFALCFLHHMLEVLQFMHDRKWTHRDLKDNILFSKYLFTITVIDFGQAEKVCEKAGPGNQIDDFTTALATFTDLYTAGNFEDIVKLREALKEKVEGGINEIASFVDIPANEKEATIELLEHCRNITTEGNAGFLDPTMARRQIAKALFPELWANLSEKGQVPEEYQRTLQQLAKTKQKEVTEKMFRILYSVKESSLVAETPCKGLFESDLAIQVAPPASPVPSDADQLRAEASQSPLPPSTVVYAESEHGTTRSPQGFDAGKSRQHSGGEQREEEEPPEEPIRATQENESGLARFRSHIDARQDPDDKGTF